MSACAQAPVTPRALPTRRSLRRPRRATAPRTTTLCRHRRRAVAGRRGSRPARRGAGRALRGPQPGRMMWREASGAPPRGVARLVGESGAMRELRDRIPRIAGSPFPVVIEGESKHREGADLAGDPRGGSAGRGARSSRSTAPCSPTSCSTRSCSATPGACSRGPPGSARGCWRSPPAARSSSTRWRSSRPAPKAKLLRALQDGGDRPPGGKLHQSGSTGV